MLKRHSLETAGDIETDCRLIGRRMQDRRAALRRIRARNIRKRSGHPINELEHLREVRKCTDLDEKIRKAMAKIHKRMLRDFEPDLSERFARGS